MKKNNNKKTHKKLIIILISIFVFLLVSATTLYFLYNKYKYSFKLTSDNINVVLNTKVNPKEYIKEIKNAKVTFNSIDTTTIGDKKIIYKVVDNLFKKTHEYNLNIIVVDIEPPKIEAKDKVSIYTGTKIDLNSYIKTTDNYDQELSIEIEGNVDNNKEGTYKVKYIVSDKSNNKSEHEIEFIVKKKTIYTPVTLENGSLGTSSKGYKIENKNGATYVGGILIANKTYALSSNYGNGLTGTTKEAFNEMKAAAALDGFDLYIGSGFRSYKTQTNTYKGYVKRDGQKTADTYSARPGHSEHQTGLAIDICARGGYHCIGSKFNNTEPAKWLSNNAYKYGFILRYPEGKTGETGYKFESWHYRYVGKDIASKLYNDGNWITLENYLGITSKYSE